MALVFIEFRLGKAQGAVLRRELSTFQHHMCLWRVQVAMSSGTQYIRLSTALLLEGLLSLNSSETTLLV